MRRRAEQVDETRQRITEAAVKLHTTVGPAHTSISKVAEEADVTRLTVYRHFADLDALFIACMRHWSAANPGPDVVDWMAIAPLDARAQRAFTDLYRWYADRQDELYPIYRDRLAMPQSAQAALNTQLDGLASVILGVDHADHADDDATATATADSRIVAAVARHLVDFWTWRSLVIERGLAPDEAAEAAARILRATGARAG